MSRPSIGRQLGLLGRDPSVRSLFLATLGSGLGTWLALVALQVDILRRTDSPAWTSALLIAQILPTFVVGLLGAPLVDRLSRRGLMVASDLVRAAVFATLPFATNATTIVALAAVAGLATGFFRPALYAGLPNLVSDRDLPGANSLLQTIDNTTWVIGSAAGGVLVGAHGPHLAYWVNAVTFLYSALLLAQIPKRRLQQAKAQTRGHWRDLADGLVLVRRSRALLTVLIAWSVGMIANAFVNVGEPFLAVKALHAGASGLGVMMAAAAVGLVVGALLAGPSIEEHGVANVYGASLGLMAVGIGAAAVAPNVWLAAASVVVSGAGNGSAIVCNALLVQRGAPDRLRGRAFTVLMSTTTIVLTIGMILAGGITEAVGPRWIWGAGALICGAAAAIGFALARGVREQPAAAVEPPPTGLEPGPAVEAQSGSA